MSIQQLAASALKNAFFYTVATGAGTFLGEMCVVDIQKKGVLKEYQQILIRTGSTALLILTCLSARFLADAKIPNDLKWSIVKPLASFVIETASGIGLCFLLGYSAHAYGNN